jgi:hypothetical protein
MLPVSIAKWSKESTVYDCLFVCCVVLSCVSVEALRWTGPPTKESYQMSVDQEVH